MNTFFKLLAGVLLLFNGVTAIYGGWNLITHPDGSTVNMSLEWLKHSPFDDYQIPGVILLVANGFCSLVVLMALMLNAPLVPWLIMAQGAVLVGWIVVQMILLESVNYLHTLYGSMGFALIILGVLLLRHARMPRSGNIA